MLKKIIVILSLAYSVALNAASLNAQRADGSTISFELSQRGHDQLLVLIQGSDCNSVLNNHFIREEIAALIPNTDLLLVEKYGIKQTLAYRTDERDDCPVEYLQHDKPSQRVADYQQLLSQLRGQYKTIILLGGSEGANIVHLLNQQPLADAVIAINGGGRLFEHDVLGSIQQSVPSDQLDEAIKDFNDFAYAIKTQQLPASLIVSEHSSQWWQEMLELDMQATINQNVAPVLVIQTLQDKHVNVSQSRILAQQLEHNAQVTFAFIDELDHSFKDANGVRQLEELQAEITNWLETAL